MNTNHGQTHFENSLSSKTIFEGNVIRVTLDEVELENNKTSMREVVHHNGGAAVIAIDDNNTITLVRQYRYALQQELLEIPAGKLEKGENPFEAAKRELAEEAGITADNYIDLHTIIPTCGYCTEIIYIYGAKNLHNVSQNLDEDEFVSVIKMPLNEAVEMVMNGEISDSKTAIAILKMNHLRKEGLF